MKKVIAFWAALCVAAACVPMVYAADDTAMLVSHSFNDLVTNTTEVPFKVKGDAYYIREYEEGRDKALCINLAGSDGSIEIPVTMKDKFLAAFDIMPSGRDFIGKFIVKSSSKSFAALQITNQNSVRTYDNKAVGCLRPGRMNRIELLFDGEAQCYDVYINGKNAVRQYYAGSNLPASVTAVQMSFSAETENSFVLVDNINLAQTGQLPDAYPAAAWNDEEIPLDLSAPSAGTAVMVKNDFTKNIAGLGISKKDNIWEVVTREDGSKCLLVEKTNESESYADVSVSGEQYRYLVLEAGIQLVDPNSRFLIGVMKSDTSKWETLVTIEGKNVLAKGRQIAALSTTAFTKLAFAMDTSKMTFDAYVDDELVLKGGEYALDGNLMQLRMEASGGESSCKLYMNRYNLYEGKEPRDLSGEGGKPSYDPKVNMFHDYKAQEALLKDKVGLHIRSGVLTAGGKREILSPAPYEAEGHTLVPVRAVSEAFGLPVDYDEGARTVTVDNRIAFTVGESAMRVNGAEVSLEAPAAEREGRTFLPLRALCEQGLGKQVYYDGTATSSGMVIISDQTFQPPETPEELQKLNDYLFYYRPSEQEILAAFESHNPHHAHPRLHTTPDQLAALKAEAGENPTLKGWLDSLVTRAEKLAAQEQAPFDYDISTGRLNYQKAEGLPSVAIGYLLTGDPKFVDYVWYVASTVCAWDDWYPTHFLDTSAAAVGLSIAYDWMYDAFTDEQRRTIEEGLYRNALSEALLWQYGVKQTGPNNSWPYMYNNWNEVCNGSMAITALALLDVYPEEASRVLANNFKGLEFSLFYYAPSGAWWEGPVYWEFGTSNLIQALSAMESALGTTFAIETAEGISNTADYGLDIQSSNGTFNYCDADKYDSNSDLQLWVARHFDKPEVTRGVLRNTNGGANILSVYSPFWADLDALYYSGPERPYDAYFGGNNQVVTMRDSWDSGETFAAVKGGVEAHSHGHMDAGTFVFDAFGERWATELGVEEYGLNGYWNVESGRWQILRNRAEGHNTLIINPDGTGIDHTLYAEAPVTRFETKPKGVITAVDMSDMLSANAASAQRGYFLTDYRKSLVVRDEVELTGPSDLYWFMYTEALEGEIDGDSVILSKNGKKVRVDFVTNGRLTLYYEPAEPMEGMPSVAGEKVNDAFRRIRAKVTGSGKVSITAKITPVGVYATDVSAYDMPIAEWKLPEGDIGEIPTLNALLVDGKPVENFSPDQTAVTVRYIKGETHVPEVTAQSTDYRIEVEKAADLGGITTVRVYSNEDPGYYNAYTVGFVGLAPVPAISGVQTWQVLDVAASAEPQPTNRKENAFDNDFSTRWSAQGTEGVWIQADLGEVKAVDRLYLSAWQGAAQDGRKLFFSISTSEDGEHFETVYTGNTAGTTEKLEPFDFARTNARYIRVNCNGTTTGDWNSILEMVPACRN